MFQINVKTAITKLLLAITEAHPVAHRESRGVSGLYVRKAQLFLPLPPRRRTGGWHPTVHSIEGTPVKNQLKRRSTGLRLRDFLLLHPPLKA